MRMLRSKTTCLVVVFLAVCLVVGCIEKHFYFKAEEYFYSKDYENIIQKVLNLNLITIKEQW